MYICIYFLFTHTSISSKEEDLHRKAITGLISIFKAKFYHYPASHTIYVYTTLVKHIYGDQDRTLVYTRKDILGILMQLRADSRYYIMLDLKPSTHLRVAAAIPITSTSS